MISSLDEAKTLLTSVKTECEGEISPELSEKCKVALKSLKVFIAKSASCSPAIPVGFEINVDDLAFARDVLEFAVMLSLKENDLQGFEQHVNQLQIYYTDFAHCLPSTENQSPIVGLHLFHLLSERRLGEFHLTLEGLSLEDRAKSPYLRYVIELERHLMEGNYVKILALKNNKPCKEYDVFIERLTLSVRESNAVAIETCYSHYNTKDAIKRLMLNNHTELENFCKERNARNPQRRLSAFFASDTNQPSISDFTHLTEGVVNINWNIEGDRINLCSQQKEVGCSVEPVEIMEKLLGYSAELERIV